MPNLNYKQLAAVLAFENAENDHDRRMWIDDVARLPVIQAAQVYREVLLRIAFVGDVEPVEDGEPVEFEDDDAVEDARLLHRMPLSNFVA